MNDVSTKRSERLLEGSRLYCGVTGAGERLAAYIRGSFLYRWLTAEPDPGVIVIDLRETWTVGPFIVILNWMFGATSRAAGGSRLITYANALWNRTLEAPIRMAGFTALFVAVLAVFSSLFLDQTAALLFAGGLVVGTLALFETRSWAELRETRPVELLIAALEPPVPHSQDGQPADDGQPAQSDTDEPEGNALDETHQRVDRDIADDGTGGERDERDGR